MKTTNDLILEASLRVFSEKGYVSATTLEISKEAGVSEMTLFRHFQTKNNLFLTAVKKAIGESLANNLNIDVNLSIIEFIKELLNEKLIIISKNNLLIKMLIRESLSNTLPDDLEFTKVISNQVIKRISSYVKHHGLSINSYSFAELVVGLLLRYAIMEDNPVYHKFSKENKDIFLNNYLDIFNI